MFTDHPNIQNLRQIEKFQEKAQRELQEYELQAYPDQTDRLGKLLLRLPALRLLSPAIMEELFFAGLIGNVQIDSIIPYILRMETTEYSSQVMFGTHNDDIGQVGDGQAQDMSGVNNVILTS